MDNEFEFDFDLEGLDKEIIKTDLVLKNKKEDLFDSENKEPIDFPKTWEEINNFIFDSDEIPFGEMPIEPPQIKPITNEDSPALLTKPSEIGLKCENHNLFGYINSLFDYFELNKPRSNTEHSCAVIAEYCRIHRLGSAQVDFFKPLVYKSDDKNQTTKQNTDSLDLNISQNENISLWSDQDKENFENSVLLLSVPQFDINIDTNIDFFSKNNGYKYSEDMQKLLNRAVVWIREMIFIQKLYLDNKDSRVRNSEHVDPVIRAYVRYQEKIEMEAEDSARRKFFDVKENDGKIVVVKEIGEKETSIGKEVARSYAEIEGVPLKLIETPKLSDVRKDVLSVFPHIENILDVILGDLVSRSYVGFNPVLLVGEPGCGKTTFSKFLLKRLGIHAVTYGCGGTADSAIVGCSRKWATTGPSLPVSLVKSSMCASPGIILDEIEKAASGNYNGNLLDSLLVMLEKESAQDFLDPFIAAPVDISAVIWFATSNSVDSLPDMLKDRFTILNFPNPKSEHLETLANQIAIKWYAERNVSEQWQQSLTQWEIKTLSHYWKGGSIRLLTKFVNGVMQSRAHKSLLH